MATVVLGFIVVERMLDEKGREKFRTVSRRYQAREAANHFAALIKTRYPRGEYYVREEMGFDGIPQNF
jgi:hypothetical protein